jgi:hypothetical protein
MTDDIKSAVEAAKRIVEAIEASRSSKAFYSGDPETVARALLSLASRVEKIEAETVKRCAKKLDLRAQDILLIGGEMSLQELRSVRAILNERARAIRNLSQPKD